METNKSKLEKVAENALKQYEIANRLMGKALDQDDKFDKLQEKTIEKYKKYKALLSKFDVSEFEKVVKIALPQLDIVNKLSEKAADQHDKFDKLYDKAHDHYEKYDALRSKFDLSHLEDNELEELFGFIPYFDPVFPTLEITMKESKIFLTYRVYKSEEDFQKNICQEITFPLSVVEKYLRKKKTI